MGPEVILGAVINYRTVLLNFLSSAHLLVGTCSNSCGTAVIEATIRIRTFKLALSKSSRQDGSLCLQYPL